MWAIGSVLVSEPVSEIPSPDSEEAASRSPTMSSVVRPLYSVVCVTEKELSEWSVGITCGLQSVHPALAASCVSSGLQGLCKHRVGGL